MSSRLPGGVGPTASGFLIPVCRSFPPDLFHLACSGIRSGFCQPFRCRQISPGSFNCLRADLISPSPGTVDWPLSSVAAIAFFFRHLLPQSARIGRLWLTLGVLVSAIPIAARLAPHYQAAGLALTPLRWGFAGAYRYRYWPGSAADYCRRCAGAAAERPDVRCVSRLQRWLLRPRTPNFGVRKRLQPVAWRDCRLRWLRHFFCRWRCCHCSASR